MTKVLSCVSNITSVSTATLKGLWQTAVKHVETGTINIETPGDLQRGRGSPNGRGAHES
jgi:hypothetical protein